MIFIAKDRCQMQIGILNFIKMTTFLQFEKGHDFVVKRNFFFQIDIFYFSTKFAFLSVCSSISHLFLFLPGGVFLNLLFSLSICLLFVCYDSTSFFGGKIFSFFLCTHVLFKLNFS